MKIQFARKFSFTLGAAVLLLGASQVNALTIDLSAANFNTVWPLAPYGTNPAGQNRWETDVGGPSAYNGSDIQAVTGYGSPLTEFYKKNNDVGGTEAGSLAGSYNTAIDDGGFTINYNSGNFVTGSPIFLYVKDGNNSPIHYVFDITGWNGTESIVGSNFWPGNGAVSHVSIFGTTSGGGGGGETVPDGGSTTALVGLALMSVVLARRFLGSN